MSKRLSLLQMQVILLVLLVLLSSVGQRTRVARAQGTTYTDPFAYCSAAGSIDVPDSRYVGPAVPNAIARGLRAATAAPDMPLDRFVIGTSWRCTDDRVYACSVGANLPCQEQANTSQTPTLDMANYCQRNADANALPGFVTGRATVYEWSCQNGVATPRRQVMRVDRRGFLADLWYPISPEGTNVTPSMPQAGERGLFDARIEELATLAVTVVLLCLLIRRRLAVDYAVAQDYSNPNMTGGGHIYRWTPWLRQMFAHSRSTTSHAWSM